MGATGGSGGLVGRERETALLRAGGGAAAWDVAKWLSTRDGAHVEGCSST
ncbi:hypothetical protein ABT033_10670 [Streptomyces pharetrae]